MFGITLKSVAGLALFVVGVLVAHGAVQAEPIDLLNVGAGLVMCVIGLRMASTRSGIVGDGWFDACFSGDGGGGCDGAD